MRTFAQKQNQPKKPVSSNAARSHTSMPESYHRADLIQHPQGTLGNYTVQRMLQPHAEGLKAGLTGTASPHFGHDFRRILIHPPAAEAIQTKLGINKQGDEYGQEADRVTEQVMRNPEADTLRNFLGKAPRAHELARYGLSGSARALPYLEAIQLSFGRHVLTGARAFVGGPAREANEQLRSSAFTRGDSVAFKQSPDLHTAAHEAAHIVQQRAGVQLPGGVGKTGDRHEQHADAVADAVVRGASAESLLDRYSATRGAGSVQVQHKNGPGSTTTDEEEVCDALRSQLENSRRVIALYREFLAGSVDWETMQSQTQTIGNAAQGVTGAGHDLPQVVQDAIEEVESFGLEELGHMGRLIVGLPSLAFGSGEFFHRQFVTNEIERQQHLNLVIIESLYAHGCPDFPGTWRGFQEQVLSVGTRGSEQRSNIGPPLETRTAVAWVEIGGEEILVLATEVAGAGRLRFVRWIDSELRDLALQQARTKQRSIPSVPSTAMSGLPTSVPTTAARR